MNINKEYEQRKALIAINQQIIEIDQKIYAAISYEAMRPLIKERLELRNKREELKEILSVF